MVCTKHLIFDRNFLKNREVKLARFGDWVSGVREEKSL